MASISAGKLGAKVLTVEKASSVAGVNGIKVSGPFAVRTSVLVKLEKISSNYLVILSL